MRQPNGVFERFLEASERTGDITLRYMFQKEMMKQQFLNYEEHKRIVDETADLVISRISVSIDVKEAVKQIDELRRSIERLIK